MYDRFNRKITYLRISITDRCNLRCTYCMPEQGIQLLRHQDILSFEEIETVVRYGVSRGIHKVRITGGEPLVRKGVTELIWMLSRIEGVRDLSMTTNGALLDQFAKPLSDAGLHRVNVSLDTLDATAYRRITRGGELASVLQGIEAAKSAGLNPIKVNCVIQQSPSEKDAQQVAAYCRENKLKLRFIKVMDLEQGVFSKVIGGEGGNCSMCNRLRLTANGYLKPCLFSDLGFSIREIGLEEAFQQALGEKPKAGTTNKKGQFSNIGG